MPPEQAARNTIYSLIFVPLLATLVYYGARYGLGFLLIQTLLKDSSGFSGLALALVLGNLLVAGQFFLAVIAAVWLYRLKREPFDGTLLAVVALTIAVTVAGIGELVVKGDIVISLVLSAAIFVITFWIVDMLLNISSTYRSGMRVMAGHKVARGTLFTALVLIYVIAGPIIQVLMSNMVYKSETRSIAAQVGYTVLQPTWIPEGMTYDGKFYNEYYTSPDDLVLYAEIVGRSPYDGLHEALELCQTGREDLIAGDGARCPDDCFSFTQDKPFLAGVCFSVGTTSKGDRVYGVRHPQAALGSDFWFVRVGGTLVGFNPININQTWEEDSTIVTDADILKIVDSLVEIPKDQIKLR